MSFLKLQFVVVSEIAVITRPDARVQ